MKRNAVKILIPILCAAILLFGCAVADKTAIRGNTSEGDTANPTGTVADTVSSSDGSDETGGEETGTQTTGGEETSDLFSARDLSAAYDEETVKIRLNGTGAEASSENVRVSGSTVTITGSGTFLISGSLKNGSIVVDASKEDKVQLVLNDASIHADSYAAIYVKQADKVFVTLADGTKNTLSNGGTFTQQDDNNVDAAVFAKDDITFNGSGSLSIQSPAGHGIVGKDEVTVAGGTYEIASAKCAIRANDSIAIADGSFTVTAGTDGLHAENDEDDTKGNITVVGGTFTIQANDDAVHANALIQIDGGSFAITAAEGMEATYIRFNGGDTSINASDDGVNAAKKSTAYTPTVEINGGTLTIVMGAGDTDGVDSNGDIIITGGTVNVTGRSTFDYDGTAQFTGGTVIINGEQVDTLPNQMMGGGMQGGDRTDGRSGRHGEGGQRP